MVMYVPRVTHHLFRILVHDFYNGYGTVRRFVVLQYPEISSGCSRTRVPGAKADQYEDDNLKDQNCSN